MTETGFDEGLVIAEVENGQQLTGNFPNAEALEHGRRVYRELTFEEPRAEIDVKSINEEAL